MITQRPIHGVDHYSTMKQGILGRSSSASEATTKYQEISTYQRGGPLAFQAIPTRRTCSVPKADTKTPIVDVAFLMACKNAEETKLLTILDGHPSKETVNQQDRTGRTGLSYACTDGLMSILQLIADIPGLDANLPDNEGNSPLMLASQAGHAEVVAFLLEKFRNGLGVDQRNIFGLTALMKASLQGRSRCVKLLLNSGASPNLRDPGRRFSPLEWARFCGRQPCAEMIEKFVKSATKRFSPLESKILSTTTSSKNRRTSEADLKECMKKPPLTPPSTEDGWLKQKLRKTLRSDGGKTRKTEFSLLTNITAASMMCASSAIMPNLPEQQAAGMGAAEKRDSKGNIVPVVPKVEVTHAPATPSLSSDDSLELHDPASEGGKLPKSSTKRKKN